MPPGQADVGEFLVTRRNLYGRKHGRAYGRVAEDFRIVLHNGEIVDRVQELDFRFDEDWTGKAELAITEGDRDSVTIAHDQASGSVHDETTARIGSARDAGNEEGDIKADSAEWGVDVRGDLRATVFLGGNIYVGVGALVGGGRIVSTREETR
jgi:hypothetical protein